MKRFRPGRVLPAAILAALLVVAGPRAAFAGPMPPQLPSAEEMARLVSQMQAALSQVHAVQAALNQVVADYDAAEAAYAKTASEIAAAQSRLDALDAELRAAQAAIDKRAASVYRSEQLSLINVLLAAKTFREFLSAFGFVKSVTTRDVAAMGRVRGLKGEAARVRLSLDDRRTQQKQELAALSIKQRQITASLASMSKQYANVRAEIDKRKSGFAFPAKPPYSYTDTYGAPRMVGTEYYHHHEGTDIFAARGTPVVAVVDGVLERVGNDLLGGIVLWVRSPGDNWTYFYAHLSGYAPGIKNGLKVHKGDVLGYIGNTGNASSSPSHLHFETHTPDGAPTNPYPILRRADPFAS